MAIKNIPLEIPHKYSCRPYQEEFWHKTAEGVKRVVLVWHRRAGKEKTCWNYMLKEAFMRTGVYYYFFPHFSQGRKILWDGIDKSGFKFLDHIPKDLLVGNPNSTEMKIRIKNKNIKANPDGTWENEVSIIQIIGTNNIDSIVGTNPVGCVFSEYSLQDPRAWQLIRPILTENGGWAIFNFCVKGDSLVFTEKGIQQIEDVVENSSNGFTDMSIEVYGINGYNKSTHFYNGGLKKLIKITTCKGYVLECTANHPIMSLNGWKRSDQFVVGDYIPIQRNQQCFGKGIEIDKSLFIRSDKRKSAKDLLHRFSLDDDVAYLLGLVLAEGSWDHNCLTVTTNDKEIQDFLLQRGFKKYDDFHYKYCSEEFILFIEWLGFIRGAKNKEFPKKILLFPKNIVASFISGYFDGDGCATKRGTIHCDSVSEKLINQMQVILLNFGIICKKSFQMTKPTKKVKVHSKCYRLELMRSGSIIFFREIKFRLKRKQERVKFIQERFRTGKGDMIPICKDWVSSYVVGMHECTLKRQSCICYAKAEALLERKKDDWLQSVVDTNYFYDKVHSIEFTEGNVYDFVIPETHSFCSNGIISHNTPRGANHAKDIFDMAQGNKDWYCQLLTVDDTQVVSKEDIQAERDAGMSEDFIQQEFYCFPKGQYVMTSRGMVDIKDVNVGDLVYTHSGRFRQVLETMSREYKGDLIRIKSYGSSEDVLCTPNHPIRVYERHAQTNRWIQAQNIKNKFRLCFPKLFIPSDKTSFISRAMAMLMAWYITEGSSSSNHIQISVKDEEESLICIKHLVELGFAYSVEKTRTGCNVLIKDVVVVDFLKTYCGNISYNKKIPISLIRGHENEFLLELMKGDGCVYNSRESVRWSYTTVSKTLAYQVQTLAHSLGYTGGIFKRSSCNSIIEGRKVSCRESYCVSIKPVDMREEVDGVSRSKYSVVGSVRNVSKEIFEGTVYNLRVQYDESYTVNGRAVHNCSFTLGIEGSYYAQYMQDARDEERIGNITWNKQSKVHTAWDIGYGDSTAIVFYQLSGQEIHIIDYYENHGEGFPHYASVLKEKPYIYGDHFAPHDIDSHSFSSGLSAREVASGLGITFITLPTLKLRIEDGIEAVRGLFPRFWIDEVKCKGLIKCLENYRKEFDDRLEVYKNRPRHDKYSHGADCARYMAIAIKMHVDAGKSGVSDDQANKWYNQFNPVFN